MKTGFDVFGHCCIALTLALTVYGQLVLKWQVSAMGGLPQRPLGKLLYLLGALGNPWILSGFAAAFVASLAWMAAMTRFDINYAYPFMSLSFVLVMGFGVVFLSEPLNLGRVVGTMLVMGGLVVIARA